MPDPRPTKPDLRVLPSGADVADAAATEIARRLADAVAARGVAHWATTGGSAAPPIYRRLGVSPLREAVDWARVHTWWGDDRFVPPDHPESNVLPLLQVLLDSGGDETGSGATSSDVAASGAGIRIPAANLHPVPVSGAIAHAGGPAWAAARYAEALASVGPAAGPDGVPVFDLVVLGVGPDGHVLSVFPGSPAWDDPALCVAIPAPDHVAPHLPRVTMHPRLLAAARSVLVVSSGASKAGALGRAWTGDDVRELPVRATRAANATWLLDEAAAAELPRA
jgi:6-phosphogluconolactonase